MPAGLEMWSQLFGGSDYYGSKPKVPEFPGLQEIGASAISANQANLPAAQSLAASTNTFNLQQLKAMLEGFSPGIGAANEQVGKLIQSQLKGEIPKDVQNVLQNSSAARAIGGGYGGSGAHGNLVARDFGRTSYDITQQGINSAERWMQMTAGVVQPSMMNATSMFMTPGMAIDVAESKFQRDLYAAGIAAAPDPVKRGRADQEMAIFGMLMSAVGGIAGAAACWVARAVYGENNPKWEYFRVWLFTMAPRWFFNLYLKHGEKFAQWISNKPLLKAIIRRWMDRRIETLFYAYRTTAIS